MSDTKSDVSEEDTGQPMDEAVLKEMFATARKRKATTPQKSGDAGQYS